MTFESLPNELLLMIFNYLSYHEIIYAFKNLNYRLDSFLLSYSCYSLDICDPIIKLDFYLNRQLLPSISAIKSLKFQPNDASILNNKNFFSQYPLDLFYSSLQSLSLYQSQFEQCITFIRLLPNFKQLKFLSVGFNEYSGAYRKLDDSDTDLIRDIIFFQIKTLKYLEWDHKFCLLSDKFYKQTDKQSTIEYYRFNRIHLNQLQWIYYHTLNLKSIDCSYIQWMNMSCEDTIPQKLVYLKLKHISSKTALEEILNSCMIFPKLKQLEIQGELSYRKEPIDGYRWQTIIANHFPQLKVLKFFFTINQWVDSALPNELIQSFMTDFWIRERKWFVNCDYQALSDTSYLYTIPPINTHLQYSQYWTQFSTKTPNHISTLQKLTFYALQPEKISSYSRFTNVHELILKLKTCDITGEQINKLVCLSSLQHIQLQFEVDVKFFSDLLEHVDQRILITITSNNLQNIFQTINHNNIAYLQKIRYLQVESYHDDSLHEDFLRNISFYFPYIKQLIFTRNLTILSIIDLLNNLNNLTYLAVFFDDKIKMTETKIQRLLIKKQTNQPKKNIMCQLYGITLHIYISNSGYSDNSKQCSLI
mgnify:FL=1